MDEVLVDRSTYLGWLVRDIRDYYLRRYLADFTEVSFPFPMREKVRFLWTGEFLTYDSGGRSFLLENGVEFAHPLGENFQIKICAPHLVILDKGYQIHIFTLSTGVLFRTLSLNWMAPSSWELEQLTPDWLDVIGLTEWGNGPIRKRISFLDPSATWEPQTPPEKIFAPTRVPPIIRSIRPPDQTKILRVYPSDQINYRYKGYMSESGSLRLYDCQNNLLARLTSPYLTEQAELRATPTNRIFFYLPGCPSLWFLNFNP